MEQINFTAELKQICHNRNITHHDLAKQIGSSRISVNRFLNGKTQLSAMLFVKILHVLGVDISAQIKMLNPPPPIEDEPDVVV